MASKKVNITNTDNKVTVTNSNNKIEVIDTNVASNIEVTRPVTTIVEVKSQGPQGVIGITGPAGRDSIFTNIGSGIYAATSSIQLTGSLDLLGNLLVNGQSVFTQLAASDNESAIIVNGRVKILEKQINGYIASASIQIGNTTDTIDCGGFF